jgi:hypothetical protein
MRVIKETAVNDIRISIFEWNQKYLVKYEWGPLEQTYKIDTWDCPEMEELLLKILHKEVIKAIEENFKGMMQLRMNFIS